MTSGRSSVDGAQTVGGTQARGPIALPGRAMPSGTKQECAGLHRCASSARPPICKRKTKVAHRNREDPRPSVIHHHVQRIACSRSPRTGVRASAPMSDLSSTLPMGPCQLHSQALVSQEAPKAHARHTSSSLRLPRIHVGMGIACPSTAARPCSTMLTGIQSFVNTRAARTVL